MWYNGYWVVLLRGYTFVLGYWVLLREWIGNRGGLDGFALDNTGGQRVVDFSCFFLLLLFENWKDWKTEDCNWFEFIRNPGSRIRNQIRNWENKREWKSEWSSVFESLRWLAVWFTAEMQWKWGVIGGIWFRISDFGNEREWKPGRSSVFQSWWLGGGLIGLMRSNSLIWSNSG